MVFTKIGVRLIFSGIVVDYDYSVGRISAISINGAPLLNNVAYYPFGPAESWTWGNAATATRSFNLDGRMSQYHLNGNRTQLTAGVDISGYTIAANSNRITQISGSSLKSMPVIAH